VTIDRDIDLDQLDRTTCNWDWNLAGVSYSMWSVGSGSSGAGVIRVLRVAVLWSLLVLLMTPMVQLASIIRRHF